MKKFGIAFRLYCGLFVMVLFTVVSVVVSVYSFERLSKAFSRITGNEIPDLVTASQLALESEGITSLVLILSPLKTDYSRQYINKKINAKINFINELIDETKQAGRTDTALVAHVEALRDQLTDNLRRFSESSAELMAGEKRLEQLARLLTGLKNTVVGKLTQDSGVWQADATAFSEWVGLAVDLVYYLNTVLMAEDTPVLTEGALPVLGVKQDTADRMLDRMTRSFTAISQSGADPGEIRRVSDIQKRFQLLATGEAGVIRTKRHVNGLRAEKIQLLSENQKISSGLADAARQLFSTVNTNVKESGDAAMKTMAHGSSALLFTVMMGILGFLVTTLYISHKVMRPILDLKAAMIDHVEGKAVFLPVRRRDEVGDMARALEVLINTIEQREEELSEAVRVKSDFLAKMSHEIRTPMNAIIGFSGLVLKTGLDERQHDYLTKIDRASQTLLGIINDILDFSKIEAGKMVLESILFSLDEVFENIASLIVVKAQEKGVELLFDIKPEVPKMLLGDPLRLGQVLINLANNAVKFTDHGQIVIAAETTPGRSRPGCGEVCLRFSVQDSGIGMSKDQVERLFVSFAQADNSTTRRYGGSGLGLVISKQLVEMMDGEIRVESKPGSGSRFWFTARFGRGLDPPGTLRDCPESLVGTRILLVDDNAAARQILSDLLVSFKFSVTVAASGDAALKILEQSADAPYQLVVLDYKMPGMNGIETAGAIKSNTKLARIPAVLMITAYGRAEIRKQAERVGVDSFLVKPVNPSLLFDTILGIFGKPVCPEPQPRGDSETVQGIDALRGTRVLLVEDDEINQEVALELLAREGIEADVAVNGREALSRLRRKPYGLVLMDINMPEMDGFSATRAMRRAGIDTPVIATTAHAVAGYREKCVESGMNDYVTKPINPKVFFSTLVKWGVSGECRSPGSMMTSPEAAAFPWPGKTPGLDIRAGIETVAGSEKTYLKILKLFRKNQAGAEADIRSAIDVGDPETAGRLAHSVKGVAANIGARQLWNISARLERAVDSSGKDETLGLLAELSDALGLVMDTIDRILDTLAGVEEKQVRPVTLDSHSRHQVLQHLRTLEETVEVDLQTARRQLKLLDAYVGTSPEFAGLARAMDDFDDEQARQHLHRLREKIAGMPASRT